jgi:hypothetical protein
MHSLPGDSAGGYLAVQTFLQQTHPKICGAVGICPPLLGSTGETDSAVVFFFRDFKQQTGGFNKPQRPNQRCLDSTLRLDLTFSGDSYERNTNSCLAFSGVQAVPAPEGVAFLGTSPVFKDGI